MRTGKHNEYGVVPKYDTGDIVRVWAIHGWPVGKVEGVVDDNAFPMKFSVRYVYPDSGVEYLEEFNSADLTLVERRFGDYGCNCQTKTGKHLSWCNASRRWHLD